MINVPVCVIFPDWLPPAHVAGKLRRCGVCGKSFEVQRFAIIWLQCESGWLGGTGVFAAVCYATQTQIMYCYVPRFAFSLTERVNTVIYCDRRGCFGNGPSNSDSKQDLEGIGRRSCLCAEQKLVLTLVLNGSWLDCIFGCPYIYLRVQQHRFAVTSSLSSLHCVPNTAAWSVFSIYREPKDLRFVSSSFCYLPQLSSSEFSTPSAL